MLPVSIFQYLFGCTVLSIVMTKVIGLKCLYCGAEFEERPIFDGCPRCPTEQFTSNLVPVYDYKEIKIGTELWSWNYYPETA